VFLYLYIDNKSQSCFLNDTPVTDEGVKGVKALAGVHTIDLGGTSVTDGGVKTLAGVHTIDLENTSVTDEGIKALVGVHLIGLNHT